MENFQEGLTLILKGFALLVAEAMPEQKASPAKRAFTLKQAADYCGVGRTTLGDAKRDGLIKTEMVGGRPKYLVEELDRFIESRRPRVVNNQSAKRA